MLTFGAFLLFVALAAGANEFKAEHCKNVVDADREMEIIKVDLKTNPIVVPGVIEAGIKFKVNTAPVPGHHYDVEFKMQKSLPIIGYFTVPCVDGLGSCTYDFCELLANKSKELAKGGKCEYLPCSCDELKVGTYDVPSFQMHVTKEQLSLGDLIYGDYKTDVTIKRRDTQETLVCVHLEFSLTSSECTGIFCDD